MDFGLLFRGKRRQDETLPLEEGERRFFLEFLLVFAIICCLLALYTNQFTVGIMKAKVVEAVSLAQGPRLEAIVHHAATGTWPDSAVAGNPNGKYVCDARISDGAILVRLCSYEYEHDHTVSFVPAVHAESSAVVVWLCGAAEPPPGDDQDARLRNDRARILLAFYLPPTEVC